MSFTKYLILFLPLAIITFSTNLFPTIEKILLALLSKEDMEASLSAYYAVQIFQMSAVSLVMMAQVYVGSWYGEKKWNLIGPGIWQFIWFSIFSIVIILPLGYFYGNFYFKGTVIEDIALPYYYFLLVISFLFPIGGALTCFFLGQGKTTLVFIVTLVCHFIKLPLGYILIFGWKWVPSLGIMGGALSIFITQLGLCTTLLFNFLNKKNHRLYRTRDWRFNWSLFWECIQPGILRAINRLLTVANWGAITYLMTQGGEHHLLVLSIGGTLILLTTFFGEAICMTQMTVISQILGSKNYASLYSAFVPSIILTTGFAIVLSICLLIFPNWTFLHLFSSITLDHSTIRLIFTGIWCCSTFWIFSFIPIGYILAFKDTYFSLIMGFVNWIVGFFFIYICIEVYQVSYVYFWFLFSFLHVTAALLYSLRTFWLIEKSKHTEFLLKIESKA